MKPAALLPAVLVALTAACFFALGGPLDPPAGPITSTYKTLQEMEPRTAINAANTPGDDNSIFKITQPGSYYLTGNITGENGRHGIEIVTSGVTLDLNGFDLVGVRGSLDGVSVTQSGVTNITVRNGSVREWIGDGVDLGTFAARACAVADIHATDNSGNGIRTGSSTTISACTATENFGHGIDTGTYSTVAGCTANLNDGDGIRASSSSAITGCTAGENSGDGFDLSSSGSGSTISGCAARGNLTGIAIGFDSRAVGNNCNQNTTGILVSGSNNRIEGNNCTENSRGVDVNGAGNIIIRNTCANNNTNWDIVANNVYGPIINRTAPASAAVLGDAAPSSLGSTDPNANFSY